MKISHTDKIGSLLWLALAVAVYVASMGFSSGTAETDAGFYPRVVAVLIAVFALVQLAKNVSVSDTRHHEISLVNARRVVTISLMVAAYALLLPWLGFVTGSVLFLAVGMIYSGARSPKKVTVASVGLPLLLYYVFSVFLRIPLPESPFVPVESLLPGVFLLLEVTL